MNDDIIIEKIEKNPQGENPEKIYYRSVHLGQGGLGWKAKLKIAAFVLGGIAVGTLFFLFFITLFIYCFIPLLIIFSLWSFLNRRR